MNKQKQQEIRGFTGWPESCLRRTPSPETKLQSYYDHHYDDFPVVLKKKKKKLAVDPSCRESAEALAAELGASVDARPALQHL